jgi:molybdopterin-guanine dinucleotide biosynthesis protein A
MGRPKALLPFDGHPVIEHVVTRLRTLCEEVVIVAAAEQDLPPLPATVVRDAVAYQGPVSGISSGLAAIQRDTAIVVACDSPFLELPLLSYLIESIREHDIVVPVWGGRLQPLHGVYRKSILPIVRAQLERGELRPVSLFDQVRTRTVDEEDVRRFDPEGLSFFNMNTPEEYARALELWDARRKHNPGQDVLHCTVELFGVARLLTHVSEVPLTLHAEATLSDVFRELSTRLPVLVGRVIDPRQDRLVAGMACNINGLSFARTPATKIAPEDRIVILAADAGG